MDQDLGTDQDLWDGRIFQDHDGQIWRLNSPNTVLAYYNASLV